MAIGSTLSAEAIMLSVQWAKSFYPWLWSKTDKHWTDKGRSHPLLLSNQEQLQYALDAGWTPDKINQVFIQARKEKKKPEHIYLLLKEATCGTISASLASNLLGKGTEAHPATFDRGGAPKTFFYMRDLMEYASGLWPMEEATRKSFAILVMEWGLDLLLYSIDIARAQKAFLRSPFGLKIFMDGAKAKREYDIQKRKALAQEAILLERASHYDNRADIDFEF